MSVKNKNKKELILASIFAFVSLLILAVATYLITTKTNTRSEASNGWGLYSGSGYHTPEPYGKAECQDAERSVGACRCAANTKQITTSVPSRRSRNSMLPSSISVKTRPVLCPNGTSCYQTSCSTCDCK